MECAGRGLGFWAYQTTQETSVEYGTARSDLGVYCADTCVVSVYHQYLGKTWSEKFGKLQAHLDTIVNEANSQIGNLTNTVASTFLYPGAEMDAVCNSGSLQR
jgi:E3 ubiquitin-protein ligase CCNP1IP1